MAILGIESDRSDASFMPPSFGEVFPHRSDIESKYYSRCSQLYNTQKYVYGMLQQPTWNYVIQTVWVEWASFIRPTNAYMYVYGYAGLRSESKDTNNSSMCHWR